MDKTPRVSKASVAMNWREMIQDGLVTMKTIVEIRYAGRKQHPGGNTFWGSGWRKFSPTITKTPLHLDPSFTQGSKKSVSPRVLVFPILVYLPGLRAHPAQIQIPGPEKEIQNTRKRPREMGPQNKLSARVVTTKIVAQSMIDIIRMGPVLEAWKRGELNAKAHKNVSPTSSVVIRYV